MFEQTYYCSQFIDWLSNIVNLSNFKLIKYDNILLVRKITKNKLIKIFIKNENDIKQILYYRNTYKISLKEFKNFLNKFKLKKYKKKYKTKFNKFIFFELFVHSVPSISKSIILSISKLMRISHLLQKKVKISENE